jgi:hemoglobin-like flavoprotein
VSLNIELLKSSFAPIREREVEFTTHFYSNLFEDYPEVKSLFANTHMEKQAKQLFRSLVLVVDNLHRPDVLATTLQSLGTRHVQYRVLPEHYPMVGNTLLKALSLCLDKEWTPRLEKIWSDAYTIITQSMLNGTEYPTKVLSVQTQKDEDH